jgi:hypothetical protein
MPNPTATTLNPDALRYSEINRRSELARTPIQFSKSLGAGLQAGKAVEDLQAEHAKKEKAAQFEQILQAGLPAMKQAWGELTPEDQKRVPDPSLFTDSRDATVSWWNLATEAHARAQVGTSLAAGNYDEAAGAAAGMSKDPTSLINEGRKQAATDKANKEKTEKEAGLARSFSAWRKSVSSIMDASDYQLDDKALNKITASFPEDLSGYEPAEKWRDNLVKKAAPPNPNGAANQGLKESGQLFTQEQKLADDFRNETKNFQPALTSYAKTVNAIKQNNPLDAYAAVINFVKTLDPTSTVREGEKLTAENSAAGGKWEAFKKWANQVADGKLTDDVRRNLAASAKQLIDAEFKGYSRAKGKYKRIIAAYAKDGYKFNEERILGGGDDEINAVLEDTIPGISPEPSAASPAARPAAKPVKPKSDPLGLF